MSKYARQHHGKDADRAAESSRILARVDREAGTDGASWGAPPPSYPEQPHPTGHDVIEDWGTRIGRALGFLLTVGIVAWLVGYVLRGL